MKNIYLFVAGGINILTALLHLIGGQIDLVNPLLNSGIGLQQKGELVGVWHMVTVLLFMTSYHLLRTATQTNMHSKVELLRAIAILYCLLAVPFIGASFWMGIFAPQWLLLLPIGLSVLLGLRKTSQQ